MSLQEAATTLSTSPGSEDQEYIPLTPHHLIFQPDISVDVTNHRNYPFLCIGVFIMTGVYKYDDFKGIYIHVYLYEDPIAILMIKNTPKNGTSKNSGTGKRSEWYMCICVYICLKWGGTFTHHNIKPEHSLPVSLKEMDGRIKLLHS